MPARPPGEGTPEETDRHRTLLEINNALISNLTREALFHAIARALRQVVPFERTAIFLHDAKKDVLKLFILESSLPSSYFTVGLEMDPAKSHVGLVFQRQQPVVRGDLRAERLYPAEDWAYEDGVRSYVIVPLIARGRSIGTLAVASTTPHQYAEPDVRFLQEVANQVALAVENMKAYEELTDLSRRSAFTAERYRTLLEINNAIISNLTQEALLHTVCQALQRPVAFDRVALALYEPAGDLLRLVAFEGPFRSAELTMPDLEKILGATLTGMTVEQFDAGVKNRLATAHHPRWKRPYTELVYQPMLEVMNLLRANGYKTYFVTGGGQDFVRAYSEQVYGIPPEQVVGSAGATHFGYDKTGKATLTKVPRLRLNDDKAGKPEGIHLMIGRRPVAAFGNSIGDKQMLDYTQAGDGARLMMLVHHDDSTREYAYGAKSKVGTFPEALMVEAQKKSWIVISMKNDWKRVFGFE